MSGIVIDKSKSKESSPVANPAPKYSETDQLIIDLLAPKDEPFFASEMEAEFEKEFNAAMSEKDVQIILLAGEINQKDAEIKRLTNALTSIKENGLSEEAYDEDLSEAEPEIPRSPDIGGPVVDLILGNLQDGNAKAIAHYLHVRRNLRSGE